MTYQPDVKTVGVSVPVSLILKCLHKSGLSLLLGGNSMAEFQLMFSFRPQKKFLCENGLCDLIKSLNLLFV